MGFIQAHRVKRIITWITTFCWLISSNVCVLAEMDSACEISCSSDYDYDSDSDHASDHPSSPDFERGRDHDPNHAERHPHDFGQGADSGGDSESEESELCCTDLGRAVLPSQDVHQTKNPLADAVSYFIAWLVSPLRDNIKPRKEFQDTGPPQVVSSVQISLVCCLLSNAPPCLI